MEKEKGKEGRGIRVTDRRAFDATGERKQPDPAETSPKQENGGAKADPPGGRAEQVRPRPQAPLDFDFFIQNLYVAALVNLGEVEDPVSKETSTNLDAARQTIDLLGILEEKTRGNLEAGEKNHLEAVLYDLRMRFAAKVKPT